MRNLFVAAAFSLCFAAAAFGADAPATCDSINAARGSGAPVEEIAEQFGTTRARVAACARVEQQHAEAAARRDELEAVRAARGLSH